jgi:hypothetical protein
MNLSADSDEKILIRRVRSNEDTSNDESGSEESGDEDQFSDEDLD